MEYTSPELIAVQLEEDEAVTYDCWGGHTESPLC